MKTPFPSTVRLGIPGDEDQIYKLMCLAYEEQPIFPLDEDKMREMIKHCVNRKGGFVGVIDGEDGKLEGYIIAVLSQFWYTKAWHLEELSNFVRPDLRALRPGHAKNLINYAKAFADVMDYPIIIGILSTQKLEAKIRLYRRQATQVGAVFAYNTGHLGGALSEMG